MEHQSRAIAHLSEFLGRVVCASLQVYLLGIFAIGRESRRPRTPPPQQAYDLHPGAMEDRAMSLARLLGFRTLACGCVIGRYRELATSRELTYIEEKGPACEMYGHRRNHTIATERASGAPEPLSIRAS